LEQCASTDSSQSACVLFEQMCTRRSHAHRTIMHFFFLAQAVPTRGSVVIDVKNLERLWRFGNFWFCSVIILNKQQRGKNPRGKKCQCDLKTRIFYTCVCFIPHRASCMVPCKWCKCAQIFRMRRASVPARAGPPRRYTGLVASSHNLIRNQTATSPPPM
jgi:hypothetical protein